MVRYMHLNWIQLQRRGGAKEVERSVYSNYLLEVQASCLQHKIKKNVVMVCRIKKGQRQAYKKKLTNIERDKIKPRRRHN